MDRVAYFRNYLSDHPDDRFATYSLGLELKKAGQPDEAERVLRHLVAVHPDSGAGHYQLGQLLAEQGRGEEALEAWEAGLQALRGVGGADARRSLSEIQQAMDALEDELDDL